MKLLLGAVWAGVVVPGLLMSTMVAMRFNFASELGEPLASVFYAPTDVIVWAREWGLMDGYRRQFLQGVALAFAPSILALLGLGLRTMAGALSERPSTAAAAPHFRTGGQPKKQRGGGA